MRHLRRRDHVSDGADERGLWARRGRRRQHGCSPDARGDGSEPPGVEPRGRVDHDHVSPPPRAAAPGAPGSVSAVIVKGIVYPRSPPRRASPGGRCRPAPQALCPPTRGEVDGRGGLADPTPAADHRQNLRGLLPPADFPPRCALLTTGQDLLPSKPLHNKEVTTTLTGTVVAGAMHHRTDPLCHTGPPSAYMSIIRHYRSTMAYRLTTNPTHRHTSRLYGALVIRERRGPDLVVPATST